MKKKIMALILVAALAISAMSILAVQAAAGLEVTVDGSNVTFKVNAATADKDWIGVYKVGETYGPEKDGDGNATGNVTSILWWYPNSADTKTIAWPADKAKADATTSETSAKNRPADINEDFTLKPGKYYAVLLANDGYELVAGTEKVEFEIKEPTYTEETTEFQSSIDFINGESTGGNHGGQAFFVKGDFTFTDKTVVTGWLAVEAGISKYQYSTDGENWFDAAATIDARSDLAGAGIPYEGGHSTAGFVDLTATPTGDYDTLYFRAITKDNKVVNFLAFTTGAADSVTPPSIGSTVPSEPTNPEDPSKPDVPSTGDSTSFIVIVAMGAVLATVVLKKKRTEA